MSAGLAAAPAGITPPAVAGPVTQPRVVRSEWLKLRALRSTWCCALITVVVIGGVGAVLAGGKPYRVSPAHPAATAVSVSLYGILLAQLVIGVLGVLMFSGEYGTGMIRASLAVVPARLPVLWAKLIVLAGLVLPVTLLAAVAEFFVATGIQTARGASAISLADPGVLRTVIGASLYLSVAAVIGLALVPCSGRPPQAWRHLPGCSSSRRSSWPSSPLASPASRAICPRAPAGPSGASRWPRIRWVRGRDSPSCADTRWCFPAWPPGSCGAATRELGG